MLAKILSAFVAVALAEGASSWTCEAPDQGCTSEQPVHTNSLLQVRKGKKAELSSTKAQIKTDTEAPILYSRTSPVATDPQRGMVTMEHRMVGCFPRSEDDPSSSPSKYMDDFCVTSSERTVPGGCRSGLPFFRLQLREEQSYLDCFTFCLSKGMDLFGVIPMDGFLECRCGASRANVEAWGGKSPRPELLVPRNGVDEDDTNCALVVWQYTGGLQNGGVPPQLVELTDPEQMYVESITAGEVGAPQELVLSGSKPMPLFPIWTASTWSVCEPSNTGMQSWGAQCNAGCTRKRAVSCTNATDGAQLEGNQCPGSMMLAKAETCACQDVPCKDECQPGFLSTTGTALTCSDEAVKQWCDNDNADDPVLSTVVRERCPETCGTCPGVCHDWCPENNQAWSKKCTWHGCKACSDCP